MLDIDLTYAERVALAKFRCRSNYLPISKAKFYNVNENDIKCALCDINQIGDEFHYLFNCDFFENERKMYIPNKYSRRPNIFTLKNIFTQNTTGLKKLAKFVVFVMKILKLENG